jgi:hypothetical protein
LPTLGLASSLAPTTETVPEITRGKIIVQGARSYLVPGTRTHITVGKVFLSIILARTFTGAKPLLHACEHVVVVLLLQLYYFYDIFFVSDCFLLTEEKA